MKKSLALWLTLALLCALLAGCGTQPTSDDPSLSDEPPAPLDTPAATMRCRIITADGDNFLVASVDSEYSDVYSVSLNNAELLLRAADGDIIANLTAPVSGAMIEVGFNGEIMETYPGRFGDVTRITVLPDEFDDRCALYLGILEELWNEDDGLNAGITCVSVDLSATSLTPAERSAVAWAFAQSHDVEELEYSYAELVENGYIDGTEQGDDFFPHWEDGVLFTLTEDEDAAFNLTMDSYKGAVSLRAEKWRSALGAYGFTATAMQDANGAWGKPSLGAGWIS